MNQAIDTLDFRLLEYGSDDHYSMVALRNEVLRKPLGLTLSADQLQQEINDILIGGFIKEKGKPVLAGCCILTPANNNTVQLRQMAITPQLQGKGIGSKMVTFAEQYAINKGWEVLTMHARKYAVGFYQQLGYKIYDNEFIEVGISHYIMKKKLE